MALDPKAAEYLSRGYCQETLEPRECEYLLTFGDKSPVARLAVSLADRLNHHMCSETGQIMATIDVSTGPCYRDCSFCRWGESRSHDVFKDIEEDILLRYVEELGGFSDVKSICLNTCGDMSVDRLADYVYTVKKNARKGTQVFVDTGELSKEDCITLKDAGLYGAIHSYRIGEGTDTGIKSEERKETIRNLVSAGIAVTTGVGPIGPDHMPKDIVKTFFETVDLRCCRSMVYPREPVPGTKFNQFGRMSPARMAQIRAVFTLATSRYNPPVREPAQGTFVNGNNIAMAEYNGNDRKEQLYSARRRLFNNGYERILKVDGSTTNLTLAYLRQTGSV
ncbi:MAG: radical SAM [archaeon]|nr:radical SAM [archaeon]